MKRYLIDCWTNWCGEEETYSAIAHNEEELETIASTVAYDNFADATGFSGIAEEVFPDISYQDLSDEQIDELYEVEGEYYGYNIIEWDETRPEEEWDWYELVYDANENDEEDDNGEV